MGLILMCASNLARPQIFEGKDERKGKKTSWLGINENSRPEKFQDYVKYTDLFLTLQSLNNLG